jgi:hypothetical protein
MKVHWAMSGKQLQLVEGGQQWQAYGLALIRQELELQQVTRTQILYSNIEMPLSVTESAELPMQVAFCPEKCTVLYAAGSSGCTGVASEQCVVIYENKCAYTSRDVH